MKKLGIMAYGDPADRKRVERVAAAHNMSASQWIILQIRKAYAEIYGTTEVPKEESHEG